jgi:protein-tyrosine phosphatase
VKILFRGIVILLLVLASGYFVVSRPQATIEAFANPKGVHNLHLVDADPASGFAIYRLGEPDAADIRGLCELGVTEIAVLAGTALEHEIEYQSQCPELRVVYNHEDDLSPLSDRWLARFDEWVARARAEGRKIAFRCSCGCHRTGRLAAYYQMRYRGLSAKDAWDLAQSRGIAMHVVDYFASLQQQIIALEEHIQGLPCSQGEYCVVAESSPAAPCHDVLTGCGWETMREPPLTAER